MCKSHEKLKNHSRSHNLKVICTYLTDIIYFIFNLNCQFKRCLNLYANLDFVAIQFNLTYIQNLI